MEEHRFHEASCTIEASARIYACRVDYVHNDTYRVLGSLNTGEVEREGEGEGEGGDGKTVAKRRRIVGVNTLEKNEANIMQQGSEVDEQSDPMFRLMAAQFDAGGARGLLLSHLPTAEDLSLVFNGDVPITRARETGEPMFSQPTQLFASELGLGDPENVLAALSGTKLLAGEVDAFRRELFGSGVDLSVQLSPALQAVLGSRGAAPVPGAPLAPLAAPGFPDDPIIEDGGADYDGGDGMPMMEGQPADHLDGGVGANAGGGSLPLGDLEPLAGANLGEPLEDMVAFDELFDKFCGGQGPHQFAYFDECWSKLPRDGPGVLQDGTVQDPVGGILAPQEGAAAGPSKDKTKKPLFDLSDLDKPPKAIETEPAHKHQLSEKAAHWQLHKDVPPYMIDRITMPSWPTWSKCDFACLGLRPHLMLKLVRKPQPPGDGPHAFTDLFSTVVVENPDAFPWLAADKAGADYRDDEDARRSRGPGDLGGDDDEDFDCAGLPAHLDVDPQGLFLQPDDNVVPGCDEDALPGGEDDGGLGMDDDFGLVDRPNTVGGVEIGYSSNSKFVDVKLVKKHLWDCINDDITNAKAAGVTHRTESFQQLVDRTVAKMPKAECENLSVPVCFICALHLCNEKNLELDTSKSGPLSDFAVVGPP